MNCDSANSRGDFQGGYMVDFFDNFLKIRREYPKIFWTYIDVAKSKAVSNSGRSKRLLKKAENKAENFNNLIHLANTWVELFNDKEMAEQVLKLAEEKANNFYDVIELSENLVKLLNDEKHAKQLIQNLIKETEK